MKKSYTTGSSSVDAMLSLNIQGNMVPFTWYQTILRPNGKPYLLAIIILSDLVYWFKPVEIREEESERFLGWKKRFKADLLQKSYQNYADLLGESKRSIKAAMDVLENLGVIRREFRDIQTGSGIANNVMFIDLDVDVLRRLTYPEEEIPCRQVNEKSDDELENDVPDSDPEEANSSLELSSQRGGTKFCRRVVQNSAGGSHKISGESPTKLCKTNTENTTEITGENNLSIDQGSVRLAVGSSDGSDEMDEANAYISLIRENISYDALMAEQDMVQKEMYEELYLLICDVVCKRRKSIRIGGEDLPYELVRSRFLKIGMHHLQYVSHMITNTKTEIRNIRAYMLTALYQAPTTAAAYWSQKATHDIYNGAWNAPD